jgi:hypothetical protein
MESCTPCICLPFFWKRKPNLVFDYNEIDDVEFEQQFSEPYGLRIATNRGGIQEQSHPTNPTNLANPTNTFPSTESPGIWTGFASLFRGSTTRNAAVVSGYQPLPSTSRTPSFSLLNRRTDRSSAPTTTTTTSVTPLPSPTFARVPILDPVLEPSAILLTRQEIEKRIEKEARCSEDQESGKFGNLCGNELVLRALDVLEKTIPYPSHSCPYPSHSCSLPISEEGRDREGLKREMDMEIDGGLGKELDEEVELELKRIQGHEMLKEKDDGDEERRRFNPELLKILLSKE